MKHLQLEISLC